MSIVLDAQDPSAARTWREEDLMRFLGYQTEASFQNVVTRAMQACLSLGIRTEDDFIRGPDGYRFTRFACYLVSVNGDPKKKEVAAAQAYFAKLADTFATCVEHAEGVERVLLRKETTDGIKTLESTAKQHGIVNYAFFQNKGYRGMYNMGLQELIRFKGAPAGVTLFDHMGREELAANLFRITQTESKIRKNNIVGQQPLEDAAYAVGRTVRDTMRRISGTVPEHLPLAEPIQEVKKKLKVTGRKLKELDKKPSRKRLPPKSGGG